MTSKPPPCLGVSSAASGWKSEHWVAYH